MLEKLSIAYLDSQGYEKTGLTIISYMQNI